MTGTGQRVSNVGDISEVNYTLGVKSTVSAMNPFTRLISRMVGLALKNPRKFQYPEGK